jgi:hypothetical protein
MNDKFKNLPVEEDTKIIFSSPMRWGELDIVYEKWVWDGITAESIIFLTEDVSTLDDAALEADIRNGPLVKADSQITIKRTDKFTFVNFNFTT